MKDRRPFKLVEDDSWIAGVCGGIAYAYGIPVTWVRIFFFLFVFILTNPYTEYVGQLLFWIYLLAWFFAPEWEKDPKDYGERTA